MQPIRSATHSCILAIALSSVASAQFHEVYSHVGSLNDQAGRGVAGLGDVDGDGVEDYAVGSPFDEFFGNVRGKVVVYSGKTGGPIRAHVGENDGDRYGWSVDGLGDMNGDGFADYIVGAPYWDAPGFTDSGRAYVYSGATGGLLKSSYLAQVGALSGFAVCGPGDVNGDGTPDFALSAPYADNGPGMVNNGRVSVQSGVGVASVWVVKGTGAGDLFGYSMDGVGDITGDGRAELVVGAPNVDFVASNIGQGYVLDGKDGSTVFARVGSGGFGYLGWSVAGVGDVNGDGTNDVAFGEPFSDVNGTDSGRVLVSSGASPHNMLNEVIGPAGTRTGYDVCGLGDADGDGTPDYACSAPWANFFSVPEIGWIYLISGASGTSFATLGGANAGDFLGVNVDGIGDMNDDGFADLIVGAPFSDVNSSNSGLARVFLNMMPAPDDYCVSKVTSDGCLPWIDFSGTPSLSIADDFTISAYELSHDVPGILIWSHSAASIPFGGGTLCVAPPVFRTAGQNSGSGGASIACPGIFDYHFSQAYMTAQGLSAGTQVFAQYWSRDTGFGAPNNMNLTEALEFTVIP